MKTKEVAWNVRQQLSTRWHVPLTCKPYFWIFPNRVRTDSKDNLWLWNSHVSNNTLSRLNFFLLKIFKYSSPTYYSKQISHSLSFHFPFFLSCFYFFTFVLYGLMAQLLSPVCTEALKFQNPLLLNTTCSRSSWSILEKIRTPWAVVGGAAKRRRGCGRVRVATDNSASTNSVADDYYEVLGLVILPKPEFWSCSVDEKIWKTKRKSIFYVLRFCFLSENYISLKLDQ